MTARRALARTGFTVALTAGLGLPLSLGAAATADPSRGEHIALTCGATTYQVVVNGNGQWTPAHDTNSTRVFIPHAFIGFHGEIRDTAGVLVDSFDEAGTEVQGSGKQNNDQVCTFLFTEVSDGSDPEFPAGYTFTGSGGVSGQIPGKG